MIRKGLFNNKKQLKAQSSKLKAQSFSFQLSAFSRLVAAPFKGALLRRLKPAATILASLLIAHCSLLSTAFAAISTVDSQGGAYSSVKLQATTGYPAIASFDHKTGELRYVYWTGTQWIRGVVEEKGVTGYVSLALDSGNKPYISYYHNISKNNSTGSEISGKYGNHMVGTLKYAYCATTTCLTPEDWTKVTVAQIDSAVTSNGYTGGYTSLVFDSSGNPRIAYYDFSHKIDANDIKKGALKLAYCDSNCSSSTSWTIRTIDTDGGKSASMVIYSNKVMLSYDADEVQKIRYAEASSPFSSWAKVDIEAVVNTGNLFRDTAIAIHPTTGKPRLVYQYQGEYNYGGGTSGRRTTGYAVYGYAGGGVISRRDAYYAYCDAADCTVSTNWTKVALAASDGGYNYGYTSSIKLNSSGIPRIAYHYWGHRANSWKTIGLAQDLHYVLCGNSACSAGNSITGIDGTNNTGLYSSIILDSSNNPFISYYEYDSNQLKLYHPSNSYTDAGITADVRASDSSNGGTGLQSGDSFKILFSGATNGSACSITTANIDSILKLSNGHSWVCSGSSITAQWSTTNNTNDTLTITVSSGTGGCVPTVEVGDRVSLAGSCIKTAGGSNIILQTEIKGNTGVKAPTPTGAVAHYKMDEGAKFTAYDSAGSNHASLNNGVTWTTSFSGSGLSLDGSNDYLIVPGDPVDLDINGGKITTEAWLKPNNLFGTSYTVLGKESSYVMASNGQCAIATTGTAWAWYGGASMSRLQRDISGNKDIFRQVVCTYDSSTGLQKVYIDGVFDGSRSATGNVSPSNSPFAMGRRELSTWPSGRGDYDNGGCPQISDQADSSCDGENYWGTDYYNGKMDEVVIYNTALSETNIINRFKELPAQLERADANDTSTLGYGLQAGDTIAIRFTNETNAPTITKDNINAVLSLNIITNPSFGSGSGVDASNWTESTAADRVSTQSKSGSYSMAIINPSAAQQTVSDCIAVTGSTSYTLTAWAYNAYSSGSTRFDVQEFSDTSCATSIRMDVNGVSTNPNSGFTQLTKTFTTLSNAQRVWIRLIVDGARAGTAYWDDVSLGSKTWLDGSGNIGGAVWGQTRFTNDTLKITLSSATSAPTVATGQKITLLGGAIKDKTGTYSITGSTTIRGSYDLNGAVAYWKFDESSGNPSDSVGQYNTGTLVNTPTYAAGRFGNALTFTGGTGTDADYVYISNYPDLNPSNISVEAWMKSGVANWNTTGGVGKGGAYVLYPVTSTKNMRFYIYAGSTWQSVLFTADSSFDITQWHHYVGTWDGTNLKIYVDGVFKNTATPTGSINTSDLNNLNIGVWDSYLNGSIDEVVIYNRAITDYEVRTRYGEVVLKSAVAKAVVTSAGIQATDKVVITFDFSTAGTSITSTNINTALALSNGHSWKDGSGNIGGAVWSQTTYPNDTLTITLSTGTSAPTVAVGDTITLGTTIKDRMNRSLTGSIVIGGTFGDNLPTGKIAYWNFDEQGLSTAYDSIGNNHGTLNNSFWRTERLFKGLYFDGSRYINVPDSADFNLSSYTIDAWVKVPDGLTTGVRRIISQESGTNYWKLQLNNNKLELCDNRLTPACSSVATTTINDGEWHHIAVIRDGTANQIILYIDGVADTTVSTTGGGTAHNISSSIQIGRKSDGTEYFYGMIDELVVYNNTALTALQIQSRYRAPIKSAFTSDPYFGSGIQAGDKVIIRFHGKTNGSTINPPIDASNINTVLQLSSGSWLDGANQIGSAVWSTYKFTDDTLTITLSDGTSAPTIASGATITVNGTIKDTFGNDISDSITLSKDFDFNLPEGAVAYWKLDEGSGTTANDSFGQNNIGTITASWNATGKFGKSLNFSTTNKYASINNSYTLNPERLTAEVWVSGGTTWSGDSYFVYKNNSVRLYGLTGLTTIRFSVYVNGAWTNMDYIPSSISGWHHYVGTYDGANLRLYMDGVAVGTSVALSGVINQFDTGSFYLGYTTNGSGYYIDDAVVYSHALTAEEVLGRYGDYTVTAIARDTSNGGPGIQAGDTVTMKFSGPTNGAAISASNIETALALSNAHYWRNNSSLITSAVWSNTGGYENDTLTVTLASFGTTLPDVAPQDTITIGSPIGAKYRAFTKSAKIGGLFGDALPTGKIAYWTFNEQSGATAYDSIGNNHGTLNNSFWRTERIFKGLYFDGSRYINIPDSADFDLSSYTLDTWVKVPDGLTTGVRRVISQDDGTNYWKLQLNNNKLELCDNRLAPACSTTTTTINDGEWHHIAVIRDGAANQVLLYIDGVADTTVSTTGGGTAHTIATSIQIGRKADSTEYFYGMIDEIAVYNRVLTLAEVKSRYRAPPKVAFTSDTYFGSGIQAGDKVIIRFHGKTNGYTPINDTNINTILQLSSGSWLDGANQIGSVAWSTYKWTNDTLTITLSATTSAPTIASGATITVNGTYIKDIFDNATSSNSITLSKDFDFNLPEGAVSYWKLDEGSGTTASDRFGQNDIVSFTGVWLTSGCMFSNCLSFSTTNKYAQVNNSTSLNPERISIEAWVYGGATWSGNSFFFNSGSSAQFYGTTAARTVNFSVYVDGAWRTVSYTPSSISGWHHYVGTYDGANLKIYVDGVLVGTPVAYTGVIYQFDTGSFYLGAATNGSAYYIDDVTVYSRALTSEEVLGRYGEYSSITAIARDKSGGGPGIQSGDTVTIKFPGPTNGASISVSNIDTALSLNNSHSWKDGSGGIGGAVWSQTTYSNDTLIITLSTTGGAPTVVVGDMITINSPIEAKYRAATMSARIDGLFGDTLPAGRIAYYNFDEQSGTTAYDLIGNNNGTLNTTFWRTERLFKGLYFDGSRYVDVPDSPDFDLSSYTLDTWVKVPDGLTTGVRRVISQDDGTNYWKLQLNNNKLELCDSRLTTTQCYSTTATINDGEWHHLAVVRNGTLNQVLLYIDGAADTTVSTTGGGTAHTIATSIQIGRKADSTEYFYGMIDELAVYNRVLTLAEIQGRYRASIKVAFTSDSYFASGIQAGDKVIIRFHGKTNGYTPINNTNINTILQLSSGSWLDGAGQIGSAAWSTYKFANDTLTITLSAGTSAPTIASGATITVNGTYIKDIFNNAISDSIILSGDFNLNLPEGAVSYWRFDETTGANASDSFNGNSGTLINTPAWTTGKINNALQFAGPLTYTKLSGGTASAISTYSSYYNLNGPKDGQGSNVGNCIIGLPVLCYTWRADTAVSNEWWKVDFGSNQTISRVKVYAYTTGASSSYKVQTSTNDITWTDMGSTTTNGWTTFDFSPTTARYVRVYETANLGDGFLYITEVEVYNHNIVNNNYVQVNNSYLLNPERITVEAWAKSGATSWNVTDALVTKSSAYKLSTTSGSKNMSFSIYAGGAWRTVTFTADGSFDITQWHHYAGTYDGTNLKIYVDGVLKNTTASEGVINTTDTTAIYIGSDNGTISYLIGNIDEVAIYNRALTAEDVLGRYGEYTTSPFYITAFAKDPATPDVSGIQAGDTVEIRFPGPTNGAVISASNIDSFLTPGLHSWKNNSGVITSAVWSTRVYENDTLTITLASFETTLPDVAPQDTISMGGAGEINAKYRAATYSAKISGTFGEPLPGTPVAFWKMDENLGTIAFDSVGTNDGTLTNSPTWTNPAMFNSGLNFSGSTAYMNVSSITLSGDWSIEGWFKYPLPSTATYNSLTGDRRVVVDRTTMKLGTHNGTAFVDLDTPYLMSTLLTGWHHIAAVGDSITTTTKFYIDGVLVGTASYKSTAALTTIGNTTTGSEQFGLIDEVAVYNSALTADNVASRYLVFLKDIYAKDESRGGAGIQNGDQIIVRFDGPTGATPIDGTNINTALQLSGGYTWGTIQSAIWSTTYKENDTLTITLDAATATVAMRDTVTLGGIIKDKYGKTITGSMQIAGDFGTNLPDGAVAYWRFDETTGTIAYDSFNDNDGTLTNTPTWTTTGRFNNALSFDGVDDYVSVPDSTSLDLNRGTVEAWIYTTTTTQTSKSIISKYDGNNCSQSNYLIYITSGSLVQGCIGNGTTNNATSTFALPSGWTHVAMTWDGSQVKLYKNGVLNGSATTQTITPTINTSALYIGGVAASANDFSGTIDEVVIYNKALSATDIRTRYGAWFTSATADDNSSKGPNIQANDRVVIKFTGETNGPAINAGNINTVLALNNGHSWLDGSATPAIVSAVWSNTGGYPNDTLTITLSGPATYLDTTPAKPTVVVGDTVTLNGTITDSSSRPIKDTIAISGTFGVASTATPSSAAADDNSGKGPNIQANDRVVIKFNGSTSAPVIDATNINTILPVTITSFGGVAYRKPITITGSTGGAQTSYQVLVTADTQSLITSGKMQSTGADIRFTNASGTSLSYWIESGINTTSTKIWVKVDSIPASPSTATIYMWYGNPSASAASNGDNVFEFFDDFTGAIINTAKWVETDTGGNISQSNQVAIANGTGAWTTTGMFTQNSFARGNKEVWYKFKPMCTTGTTYRVTTMLGWQDGTAGVNYTTMPYAQYFNRTTTAGSENLTIYEGGTSRGSVGTFVCGTQYYGKTALKSTGANYYISTDATNWTLLYTGTYSTATPLKVGFTHYQGGPNYLDDVFIRQYASHEPSVGTPGAEEGSSKTWLAGNGLIGSAVWSLTTVSNDTLTITLSGPATYLDTTPARPTVVVGDTITINGTITDSSGKAIISTVAISGSFGVASTVTPSSAVADDNSSKGPNIQANDRVVIKFNGSTNAPIINATNINTILAPDTPVAVAATGGTITYSGAYTIHTFTSSGTFNVTTGGNVEVLVVAGGGGGGMDMGGGGGGGGVLYSSSYKVTPGAMSVTVGNGGAGAPAAGTSGQPGGHQYTISASNGGNSVFGTLTTIGGGRGGSSYYAYTPGAAGAIGGSGGGSSGYSDGSIRAGGEGTSGQGFAGGQGGGQYYSGGGGGAGAPGTNSTAQPNGGAGMVNSILGTAYYWGGGGGGAGYSANGGNGGIGGGGGGGVGTTTGGAGLNNGSPGGGGCTVCWANTPGGNGGANTGGGGGGGSHYNATNKGGDGGSGIIIVKYRTMAQTWLDGNGAIGGAVWSQTTNLNDTLTITLSGPATYLDTTPAKPTVVVGDTITINGTITDSSGKAIISTIATTGSFGVASTVTPSSAAADDNSGKGPNIQANDRLIITFSGATNQPVIDATNINTILPVTGKTWLDGNGAIVSANWTTNTTLTVTLSGPATYTATTPAKPTVVVGDTITINGTITDSSGKAIISTIAATGSFGVASTVTPSSAVADDNSGKGPNIQANDRVVIKFSGSTNAPAITAANINTILPVTGKTWLDGSATPAIVSAVWSLTTVANDTLTVTLSGPATYLDTTPAKPTVVVGDTVTINGTVTDSSGKAIISTIAISGSFGVASTVTPSSAVADDNSGKGPNIQANDRVVITFSGATDTPVITAANINTILPVTSKTWLDGAGAIGSAIWTSNTTLTITLSGPATYLATTPAKPTVVVGDTVTINGTVTDSSGKAIISTIAISGSFGVASTVTPSSAVADDNSGKGPNIQANDRVVIKFSGSTNAPAITAANINTILPVTGKTWLDGSATPAIVSAVWSLTTVANDTLTVTLSGPATYLDTTPTKPTVVVGDTITINGTITDSSGKAIVSTVAISGSFGVASTVTSSSAVADDNSNWGPNIQANDRVIITFSGATSAPVIDSSNINTILPVTGKTWLDGSVTPAMVSAVWSSGNTVLTITLSGPATQPETTPAKPTVVVGDTIIINGTITDSTGKLIVSSNRAITGSFGTVSGTVISSAIASDDNGKYGQTTGDKVIIKFSGQIGYAGDAPPTINAGNINTVLAVTGKTWLDGGGNLGGTGEGVWTTTASQNDTLTITLSSATLPAPTIAVGDTITLGGSTIKDKYRTTISSSKAITGDFAIPSGMKAWWKFDSTSGTTVTDSYGSYGGTLTNSGGSATTWTSGRFSNGLYLDGTTATGDYVTLTTAYALTSNWTIEGWFKWPISQVITSQQAHALVSSDASENQIVIYNQTKQLGTLSGATNYWIPNYALTNLTNGWHYVAAVGTGGSGTAGTTTFYIDGVSVGSISYKSVANIKYLGNTSGLNRPMTNAIDNIVVYDTAISATAIKNRYGAWARSAYAYGTAGDYTGITTGDQVIIRFDQSTEGNSITSSNIGTALVLSSSHIWGSSSTASWSTTIYSNDTLTITLSTGGTTPTIAKGDTITLSNNVIKDYAGRPISDPVTLQGSFDFKLPLGAIAYWRFNEGTGTTVNDSFGSNNGTASQTYLWADGMYGTKGVTIDASNEAVALTSALNMPNEWTIMGWLKTPLVTGTNNALTHGTDHEHAININTQGANHELGNLSIPSEGNNFRGTGYYVNKQLKNGWHHVTAVGTGGSGTAGTTKYYINGQYVGEAVYSVNGSKYKAYTDIASIGNNTGAGAHAIGTTIDEISVYDRPLSETEIKQHYGARLKYAHANDVSGGDFGIDAGDQIVIGFDGETNGPSITTSNIDTVLKLSNGHTWKDGNGAIGSAIWSTSTGGYTKDTLTITLSTGLLPPTITTRDTITLDGVTIKDLNRVITGSIDISGDFDGVAAYYDLDEASAVTAADSVNGNNGTLSGSTLPAWVSGYSGAALDFNDTNTQYVTIPNSNSFNLTSYTIEAWIKLPKTIPSTNYMRIVSQESSAQPINYWSLAINPSGQLVYCDSLSSLTTIPQATYNMGGLPAGQNPKCETVTTKDLRDEKWHFVAVVRDTFTGNFKFFIDHTLEKTVASGAGSGTHTITGTVEIGRKNGYTGCSNPDPCSQEYFRGTIDNIAIYNYALTDIEVNAHHFLYPSEAHASDTSGLGTGIQANDSVTILFNGETGATAINDLTTLNNALKLPTGKTWGTTFGSAVWSTTYYTNDTLKVTFGTGANMAVGDTITLGNVINDVHGNPISGSVAITGSFAINSLLGTIAYWKFDEGINDTIGDSVGSYSGTRYSGLGTWITGKFGSALDFTGTTGYVSLPTSVPLTSDEWTIEAWFYAPLAPNLDNSNTLLIDTTTQHIVVIPVSGTSYLGVYSTADGGGFRSSGYNVANLTTGWHHLVAVGKNSKTYFYIDGSAVGTYSNYKPSASISKLGNGRNASSEFKRPWGKIDDMVIYKRALTAIEISTRAAR